MEHLQLACKALVWGIVLCFFIFWAFWMVGCSQPTPPPKPAPNHSYELDKAAREMDLIKRFRPLDPLTDAILRNARFTATSRLVLALRLPEIKLDSDKAAHTVVETARSINVREIDVFLDGRGGYVFAGFKIVEELRTAPVPLVCRVYDAAISMDAWLFEMIPCKREMAKDALLVFHKPAIPREKDDTDEDKKRKALIETELTHTLCLALTSASQGRVEASECEEALESSEIKMWAMSAETAKEMGLVDTVLPRARK